MLLKRLLLVTLLTISSVISQENVTEIINNTTTTSTTSSPSTTTPEAPTIETFTLPTADINTTILPVIVVESADGDDVAADMDPVDASEVKELDLTTLEEEDNYQPNNTLIETNADGDLAPKIVGSKSEEEGESNGFGITHELMFLEPENSTDLETSTNDNGKAFLKPDGVVLPTDTDYFVNGSVKVPVTTEPSPTTFWDRAQNFVGWFSAKNPQWTILVLVVMCSLILLLLFLVFRECCKERRRRRNPHSYHFTGGITDDLYNTSSQSHRYEKVTLPNQTEVTMQLVSADNSVV